MLDIDAITKMMNAEGFGSDADAKRQIESHIFVQSFERMQALQDIVTLTLLVPGGSQMLDHLVAESSAKEYQASETLNRILKVGNPKPSLLPTIRGTLEAGILGAGVGPVVLAKLVDCAR